MFSKVTLESKKYKYYEISTNASKKKSIIVTSELGTLEWDTFNPDCLSEYPMLTLLISC